MDVLRQLICDRFAVPYRFCPGGRRHDARPVGAGAGIRRPGRAVESLPRRAAAAVCQVRRDFLACVSGMAFAVSVSTGRESRPAGDECAGGPLDAGQVAIAQRLGRDQLGADAEGKRPGL